MAWPLSDRSRPWPQEDNMVFRWCSHPGKFGLLHAVVCEPWCRIDTATFSVGRFATQYFRWLIIDHSRRPIRALIFNITHGRSGDSFLAAMKTTQAAQLKIYGDEDPQTFFDHVIFCTNVTYVSGGWKKGLKLNTLPAAASHM